MNTAHLIKAVSAKTRQSEARVKQVLVAMVEAMAGELSSGKQVALRGLGRFKVVRQEARKARDVVRGEEITLGPRRVVKFRPVDEIVEKVNQR